MKSLKRNLESMAMGFLSGKSMVNKATKTAQAKVYQGVSPALKMKSQLIEKGASPRTVGKTSYGSAMKKLR